MLSQAAFSVALARGNSLGYGVGGWCGCSVMRGMSLAAVLVAFSAPAIAQSLTPPETSFVPSVAETNRQISIPVKTASGDTVLVPLKLMPSKQEEGSNAPPTEKLGHTVSPSWTLVPFLDASQKIVFSSRPTQH